MYYMQPTLWLLNGLPLFRGVDLVIPAGGPINFGLEQADPAVPVIPPVLWVLPNGSQPIPIINANPNFFL